MALTAAEQYMLELMNRARLDPLAEAARYGIDLNQDLDPGTISSSSKQVLAQNDFLSVAANDHSQWMLDNNQFTHSYADPSRSDGVNDPGDRMRDAGYQFNGSWSWGENLSVRGAYPSIDLNASIDSHHRGLFLSEGHRENLMQGYFREVGIGQLGGDFTFDSGTYDSSMLTVKFAKSGSDFFVTGVVYEDLDDNDFYTIGEGRGGATFQAGGVSENTVSSGGYSIAVAASSNRLVEVTYADGLNAALRLDMSNSNAKLDYLVGDGFLTSVSATIVSGVDHLRLLGVEDLSLTGDGADNTLVGNKGDNVLNGGGGADTLDGGEGADVLDGGDGSDFYLVDELDIVRDSGTEGTDVAQMSGSSATLAGLDLEGIERVLGTDGNDVIDVATWSGLLEIDGEAGSDQIDGGDMDDILMGGAGEDTVGGGAGNDILMGDGGFDPADLPVIAAITDFDDTGDPFAFF